MGVSAPGPTGIPARVRIGIFVLALVIPLVGFVAGNAYQRDGDAEKRQVGRSWVLAGGIGLLPWAFLVCVKLPGLRA